MIAKKREYFAMMSVGLPGAVLWHIACPKLKLCCALPEASHLTRLLPGIINGRLALLFQESDNRPSAFSDVLAKRLFVVHRVEQCSSGDTVHSHPSSFSVFPAVSRFITGVFLLSIRSMQDSVSVLSVSGARWSDVEAIHECILFCSELSHVAL